MKHDLDRYDNWYCEYEINGAFWNTRFSTTLRQVIDNCNQDIADRFVNPYSVGIFENDEGSPVVSWNKDDGWYWDDNGDTISV